MKSTNRTSETSVNVHKNAKVTPAGRALLVRRLVERRESPSQVARQVGLSARTVHKWVARSRADGEAGLADRSSRPRRVCRPMSLTQDLGRQSTARLLSPPFAVGDRSISTVVAKTPIVAAFSPYRVLRQLCMLSLAS